MQEKKDSILLFGYQKYGQKLANALESSDYQVVIADNNKESIEKAEKNGHKAYLIDIENDEDIVQILVSYTFNHVFCAMDNDEENIYLAITMKSIDNNMDIISICQSKDSEQKLELAGVRGILNTLDATAQNIYHMLKNPVMIEAIEDILYFNSDIDFVEFEVPKDSFLDGKFISEIDFKKDYNIILLGLIDKEFADKFIFATKGVNHKIDEGDILLLIGLKEDLKAFRDILVQSTVKE
jgi:voltage-gated potassium channel